MMNKLSILATIAGLSFLPSIANAQERLGDGAMGALVGGPVGLVAGGVVGYTAGPSIASSWVSGTGIIATPIIGTIHHATRLRKR